MGRRRERDAVPTDGLSPTLGDRGIQHSGDTRDDPAHDNVRHDRKNEGDDERRAKMNRGLDEILINEIKTAGEQDYPPYALPTVFDQYRSDGLDR